MHPLIVAAATNATDKGLALTGAAVFIVVTLVCAVLYLVPTFIALARKHSRVEGVAGLNILLGWTVIGWIAALVWALRAAADGDAEAPVAFTAPEPGAPEGRIEAVIRSELIDRLLGSAAGRYRQRWLALVEKAGVLDRDVHDPVARRAVRWTPSFDPSIGLFAIPWAVIRRVDLALPTAMAMVLTAAAAPLAPENTGEFLWKGLLAVTFFAAATFGEGWLLATILRKVANSSGFITNQLSPGNLIVLIIFAIFSILLGYYLLILWAAVLK